jgi:hypothetical protein
MSRSVVLFYSPYEGESLGAPLCLLVLVVKLRKNNFEPVMPTEAINVC